MRRIRRILAPFGHGMSPARRCAGAAFITQYGLSVNYNETFHRNGN